MDFLEWWMDRPVWFRLVVALVILIPSTLAMMEGTMWITGFSLGIIILLTAFAGD